MNATSVTFITVFIAVGWPTVEVNAGDFEIPPGLSMYRGEEPNGCKSCCKSCCNSCCSSIYKALSNCLGKCSFGKFSFGKCSFGKCSFGKCSSGKCCRGGGDDVMMDDDVNVKEVKVELEANEVNYDDYDDDEFDDFDDDDEFEDEKAHEAAAAAASRPVYGYYADAADPAAGPVSAAAEQNLGNIWIAAGLSTAVFFSMVLTLLVFLNLEKQRKSSRKTHAFRLDDLGGVANLLG